MTEEILNAINGEVYGVWFLIGAALVFLLLLFQVPWQKEQNLFHIVYIQLSSLL